MHEINTVAETITAAADPEANIIFGAVIDESYTGQVKCTVIATGFDEQQLGSSLSGAMPAFRSLSGLKKAQQDESRRDDKVVSKDRPVMQSTAPQFNEEELEVPTFMRKKIGK